MLRSNLADQLALIVKLPRSNRNDNDIADLRNAIDVLNDTIKALETETLTEETESSHRLLVKSSYPD